MIKDHIKKRASVLLCGALLCGCTGGGTAASSASSASAPVQTAPADTYHPDYLVLVTKTQAVPENWMDEIELVSLTNSMGNEIQLEKKTYEEWLLLKASLETDGVYTDVYSAYRSPEDQQAMADEYTEMYGEEYVKLNVAEPGYSEHHTGLSLDLYLIVDNQNVYLEEEMLGYPDLWTKVHARLAEYGFILHYMEGKENITGYTYEPWHIRYVGREAAREIMEQGITLEEYLGEGSSVEAEIDYGSSEIYTKDDMDEAISQIRRAFANFGKCEMHNIRYTDDECNSEANIAWMNELRENQNYVQCIHFLTDFHTPAENSGSLEPDTEYTDYGWYLARPEDGAWEVITYGY